MSVTILNLRQQCVFGDLKNGELFLEDAYGSPYSGSFLVKIAEEKNNIGIVCQAREFDTRNQSRFGRLVTISDLSKVHPVSINNVELELV